MQAIGWIGREWCLPHQHFIGEKEEEDFAAELPSVYKIPKKKKRRIELLKKLLRPSKRGEEVHKVAELPMQVAIHPKWQLKLRQ